MSWNGHWIVIDPESPGILFLDDAIHHFIAASKIQHGDFVAVIGLAPACIMAI